MPKRIITYQCGHQKYDFIFAAHERVPDELARYAKMLCCSCQVAKEQQQFEEVIAQADEVYNITDQNGLLIAATRTRPGFCRISVRAEGNGASSYEKEIEIAQVTVELHQRNHRDLYWAATQIR